MHLAVCHVVGRFLYVFHVSNSTLIAQKTTRPTLITLHSFCFPPVAAAVLTTSMFASPPPAQVAAGHAIAAAEPSTPLPQFANYASSSESSAQSQLASVVQQRERELLELRTAQQRHAEEQLQVQYQHSTSKSAPR